jgi:hypothetical protein
MSFMPIISGGKLAFERDRTSGMKTTLFLPAQPRRQLQSM